MKGAVAAGHPLSARAGARMLEEGGNAVDACVAAAFAAAVCESPLTGLGAGGFMLVRRAREPAARLADFFVAAPGLGLRRPRRRRWRRSTSASAIAARPSRSWSAPASVAVPGAVAGLEAAHRAYGRLPWARAVVPACELAREGVALTGPGAHPRDPRPDHPRRAARAAASTAPPDGARLRAGDVLVLPDLADTLEEVGRRGAAALYRGERARAIVAAVREGGGELTLADLAAYRVVWRRPVAVALRAATRCSRTRRPPPAAS